jgi:signal transduction histidine kinase
LACEELLAARSLAAARQDARLEAHACFALAEARGQLGDRAGALEAVNHAYDYFVTHDDTVMRDRAAVRRAVLQDRPTLESVQEPLDRLRAAEPGDALAEALFETATAFRNRGVTQQVIALYAEALDVAEPFLADQFAAAMRNRSESAEARGWVDAMLMVKQHKDRLEDAYSRLRRAETLRESLTQMIVHDLKNPLTAILPWLETIQSGALTPEETGEALHTVIDECDYLLRMIEDLNDVGKAQVGGKVEVVKEALDLGCLITAVADRLKGRAREIGMKIDVVERSPLPTIQADPEKLRRVLENLVANAIKYGKPPADTGRAPDVTIVAMVEAPGPGRDYETVRVEVHDNGMGIPLAEADRVFEPYYQAEAGRRRKAGVGLGLAFCRMVVDAHGGAIWTQPGHDGGSVFVFRLPITGGR